MLTNQLLQMPNMNNFGVKGWYIKTLYSYIKVTKSIKIILLA